MGTLPKRGSVEVVTPATPGQVWVVLSDVTRTGEWSHETVASEWVDGATGPVVGARFRGRNEAGRFRWGRVCEIVTLEPERGLQFRTIPTRRYPDSTMWTFELSPADGGTRIVQRFEVLKLHPVLDRLFHALLPPHRDRTDALRGDLERLGAVAAGSTGPRTSVR